MNELLYDYIDDIFKLRHYTTEIHGKNVIKFKTEEGYIATIIFMLQLDALYSIMKMTVYYSHCDDHIKGFKDNRYFFNFNKDKYTIKLVGSDHSYFNYSDMEMNGNLKIVQKNINEHSKHIINKLYILSEILK